MSKFTATVKYTDYFLSSGGDCAIYLKSDNFEEKFNGRTWSQELCEFKKRELLSTMMRKEDEYKNERIRQAHYEKLEAED